MVKKAAFNSNKLILNSLNNAIHKSPLYKSNMFLLYEVVFLVLVGFTLKYLIELENCECFEEEGKYKTNILFLKIFQVIILINIVLSLGTSFWLRSQKGGSNTMLVVSFILALLLGVFHFFVVLNIWNFHKSIKDDCECSNKKEKYVLYYQGILSSISLGTSVAFFLISLIFGLVMLTGKLK